MRAAPVLPPTARRAGLPVAVLTAAAVALTACSSGAGGSGGSSSGPATGTAAGGSTSAGASPTPSPTVSDAASLATAVQKALAKVTSAHLQVNTSGGTTGVGAVDADVTLAAGKTTGISTTVGTGAQAVKLVQTGGKTYIKLPTGLATGGKPWTLVSPDSSNPQIAQLATQLATVQDQASITQYSDLLAGATGFTVVGPQQVNGTAATEYDYTVDVTKLAPDSAVGKQFAGSGLTTFPVKFSVDDHDRPVRTTETITAAGQTITVDVEFSKYDEPVDISAPPADQVAS